MNLSQQSVVQQQICFSVQAFYPTNKDVNVKYGDTIAARCMFTGEGRATKTYIGWVMLLNPFFNCMVVAVYSYSKVLFYFLWFYPALYSAYLKNRSTLAAL